MESALNIFPHINASLNTMSACFLLAGFYFIMKRQITRHRFCMISACCVSALFLLCYITYHSLRTYYLGLGPTKFMGEGLIRPIYFTILISHVLLAAVVPILALMTIIRAWRQQWAAHRRIAVITFPIWVYVSITGVVIYGMLYHWPN